MGELEDEDAPIIGNISVKSNKELGSIYAEVKDSESETTLELAVPDLPEEINLDVSLSDDIEVDFSCSRAPSKVILGIDSGDTSNLETEKIGKEIVKNNIGNIFTQSQGAVIFEGSKYGLFDNVFINSAGFGTYLTKDLGLIERKSQLYPDITQSVYVTDR